MFLWYAKSKFAVKFLAHEYFMIHSLTNSQHSSKLNWNHCMIQDRNTKCSPHFVVLTRDLFVVNRLNQLFGWLESYSMMHGGRCQQFLFYWHGQDLYQFSNFFRLAQNWSPVSWGIAITGIWRIRLGIRMTFILLPLKAMSNRWDSNWRRTYVTWCQVPSNPHHITFDTELQQTFTSERMERTSLKWTRHDARKSLPAIFMLPK